MGNRLLLTAGIRAERKEGKKVKLDQPQRVSVTCAHGRNWECVIGTWVVVLGKEAGKVRTNSFDSNL